jgi:hypothetical protein
MQALGEKSAAGDRRPESMPPEPATADYSAAVAKAVSWLGERYLLATPVRRYKANPPETSIR